jgi:hypothetical protein
LFRNLWGLYCDLRAALKAGSLLSRYTGVNRWGGGQSDEAYIFGLYGFVGSVSTPAMKTLTQRSRSNQGRMSLSNVAQGTLLLGFGTNLRLRPRKDLGFCGGLSMVVKSWKAILVGRP